ncbi:MAG: hypothetical protein HC915_14165 [Anaerolineae bacterium]|nr:hypothetical protein [Anaerolineae bacterium]
MIQWEYLHVMIFAEKDGTRYAINGEFHHPWRNAPLHRVLNVLGEKGWELVSMNFGQTQAIFKRRASTRPEEIEMD